MKITLRGWTGVGLAFVLLSGLSLDLRAESGNSPDAAADLRRLQGVWKGVALSRKAPDEPWLPSGDAITITVSGDSFLFHRDTNFWFMTTIALSGDTRPRQLRATIRENAPSQGNSAIGKVVAAIFKVEGGMLTLAAKGDGSEDTPVSFEEENVTRYELRKIPSTEKNSPSPVPRPTKDAPKGG